MMTTTLQGIENCTAAYWNDQTFILEVKVYSLKADSRREIHHIVKRHGLWHGQQYVIVCEAFHWLLMQRSEVLNIVAFDIQAEEIRTVPLPPLGGFADRSI